MAALRGVGHRLVEDLPDDLVHPPALEGPFTASNRRIANGSGETALRAATSQHAEVVAKLLNAAHRHGPLTRLLGDGKQL